MSKEIDIPLDGVDPDNPTALPLRQIGGADWRWCNDAVQDVKALREMSEASWQHYSGISNRRHNGG